jgi:hypothetical protein
MDTEKTYQHRVGHQGLAAFLVCNGHECLGIHQSKDGRPQYLFDVDNAEGQRLDELFFDGHDMVPAVDFYKALTAIRRSLYEAKQGAKGE